MQEYLCNFVSHLLTWALTLLSSLEVQHLATEAHYIIQQSQNRGREKNNGIAPKAGSGNQLKKMTTTLPRVQTGQKLCLKLLQREHLGPVESTQE